MEERKEQQGAIFWQLEQCSGRSLEGPTLPLPGNVTDEFFYPCALTITATSFLVVHGTDIREFDAAIAGPRSNEGWREAGRWPTLMSRRISQPGCTKIGRQVIIAGGYDGGILSSTEVLDLESRQVVPGGEMIQPWRQGCGSTLQRSSVAVWRGRLHLEESWSRLQARMTTRTQHQWRSGWRRAPPGRPR